MDVQYLGIGRILETYPRILEDATTDGQLCKKDTGGNIRLRKWSRGHQFVVRAGGHIDMWQPLYK